MRNIWSVETQMPSGRWIFVHGSLGNKSYALGWFHGLTSLIPRRPYRLVKMTPDSEPVIVETDNGSRGVRPNP